ncbi:MAG: FG-GAP-like repeat-containing protein [Cyclobacteriaceae bacterium]
MNKIRVISIMVVVGMATLTMAQPPVINSVSKVSGYPTERIVISGAGFSSTPSQLQVIFEHAKGTIVSSSTLGIEVEVPAAAKSGNIEVLNLSTRLSTKTAGLFDPYYSGTTFNPALLAAPLSFSATTELFDLCTCDLDGDNKPDVAATKFNLVSDGLAPDLIILKNQSTVGAPTFSLFDRNNLPALNLGAPTERITCGDLNGDGKPDLVASRTGSTKNQIFILPNTSTPGTLSFGAFIPRVLDIGHFARSVAIHDLNADGKPEIIVSNSFNNQFYVFLNQSAGGVININPTPLKFTISSAATTYGLDIQDMDGDKKPDIVINQFQSNNIYVLRNTSSGTVSFSPPVQINLAIALNDLQAADFNEDGLLDLAATSTLTNQLIILYNSSTSGNIAFGSTTTLSTGNGAWGLDVGDIDGDQDVDIIVAVRNQNQLNVFLHGGTNSPVSFTKVDIATNNPTRNVRVGDLDGDAKPDIAFTSFNTATSTFTLQVLRNQNCFVPNIVNPPPLTICPGQTITLNSIPGFGVSTYDWKESGGSIGTGAVPSFDITTAGSFTVEATSESGSCVTTSAALAVASGSGSLPSDPAISSNSPVCTGQTLQLNTTATGVTYAWAGPNGFTSALQNPTIANVTEAAAGDYTLQVSNGTCNSNVATLRVDIASLQSFSVSSTPANATACLGSGVTLTVNNVAGHSYQWIKDGADISGQTGTSFSATQEGSYSVRVQNISLGCSVVTSTLPVTILSMPVASFTAPATACTQTPIQFTNTSTVDSRATPNFDWNFGGGATSTQSDPTHTYTTAQTANVSLTVTYAGTTGCSNTANQNVSVAAATLPAITASATAICPGETADLSITGTFTSINWSTTETTPTISVNQPGTYDVNTLDGNGCAGTASVTIDPGPTPALTVAADKTSVAPGESVQLTATGADSYQWSPGSTLSDSLIANPVATPVVTTTYTVAGSLNGGCTATETITIQVDGSAIVLNVPNAFSPNGDAVNDFWVIPGIENYSDCTLTIYDAAGRKIFSETGYKNLWNGTHKGKDVPQGTYYYLIACPDNQPLAGHVLVTR